MTHASHLGRVVVGVDGSEQSAAGLRWALRRAARTGATVEAVSGMSVPVTTPYLEVAAGLDLQVLFDDAAETLEATVASARRAVPAAAAVEITWHVVEGPAAPVLLERASEASLLVVGSRGRGAVAGTFLGSVSQQLAHHTPCPLVVVSEPAMAVADRPVARIVVGVDSSPGAEAALHWAAAEAAAVGARLRAVTTWQDPVFLASPIGAVAVPAVDLTESAASQLAKTVATVRATGAPEIDEAVVRGPAGPMLLHEAEQADLLVVGSRGGGGFVGLLLGSVSQHVAAHAPCPVVIVPRPHGEHGHR